MLSRLLPCALLLLAAGWLGAQTNNLRSYNALSARVLVVDHEFPNEELTDLSTTYALELGFRRQFGKFFGVMLPVKFGVIDVGERDNIVIVGAEILAQVYPLGTATKVSPYLHAGYGSVSERFEDANHQIPLGGGINFSLDANSWFSVQAEYRLSDQELRDNVMAGVGYVYRLSGIDSDGDGTVNRRDDCPTQPGPAATNGCPDGDGDGIRDAEDRCPGQAGPAQFGGCPDTDRDGLPDAKDDCPGEAGPTALRGCPDRDGDGISDPVDSCPERAGPSATNGCPDSDEDGIVDEEDDCPTAAGPPAQNGCPDADGDGVPDGEDACPGEAGPAATAGCPDGDGDGVPDNKDRCPKRAGAFNGCPDTDGDGVDDGSDRCPQEPGSVAGGGCPEATEAATPPPVPEVKEEVRQRLAYAARAVRFETGSARLKESSYIVLSEVGGIMRQYPAYNLTISGHTDNVGSEATNLALSERRAAACRNFIVATGISAARISSAGFGEARPVADNATAAGRQENRRVMFELIPAN